MGGYYSRKIRTAHIKTLIKALSEQIIQYLSPQNGYMKPVVMFLRSILVLLNTLFQMTLLAIDSLIHGKSIERGFKHRRIWAKRCLKILGIKMDEVNGSFEGQPALLISNHRSLIDPIIQLAYFDTFIIAKAEVSKLPIISSGAQMTGIIFVQRNRLRSRLGARNKTEEILKSGYNVLVYAEGTTGTDRVSSPFKPGTFAVASKSDIPVIPISIEYPDRKDYWYDKGMASQMIQQIGAWSTYAKMHIGEPIQMTDTKALMSRTKDTIDQNLLRMQSGWSNIHGEI